MGSKMMYLTVTIFVLVYLHRTDASVDTSIDLLLNHIRHNPSPYKLNVIAESFNGLSRLTKTIIRKAAENLAANVIDYSGMKAKLKSARLPFQLVSDRVSLTMGIVECKNGSQLLSQMTTMLQHFDSKDSIARGQYLINLITEEETGLEQFFRLSWLRRFVDLTVIEWIQNTQTVNSTGVDDYKVSIRSYNSFNNTFSVKTLTPHTELFPEKLKNLYGYQLVATTGSTYSFLARDASLGILFHETDQMLIRTLIGTMNGTVKIKTRKELSAIQPKYPSAMDIPMFYSFWRISMPIEDYSWERTYIQHMMSMNIPSPVELHLHLVRPKVYVKEISLAAILAFGGLFFTAFIFAVWAQFLGFKERNWSFLNILTAQMGGSIEHHGPMKLSERIFQMSIYIATFIVVTLGTDYMLQIFVLRQEIREIRTIRDLIDSDLNFIMDSYDYSDFEWIVTDPTLQKILNRTRSRELSEGSTSFCRLPSADSTSVVDPSVNLCISVSKINHDILASNSEVQVDKIEDRILVLMPKIFFGYTRPFFKDRLEILLYRFLEVGLLGVLGKSNLRFGLPRSGHGNSLRVKEDETKEVPLQDQLWPILAVGYAVGIIALHGELIWRKSIEHTKFGKLVSAFYSETRSNSANSVGRIVG